MLLGGIVSYELQQLMVEVRQTEEFSGWLRRLRDANAVAHIVGRIRRMEMYIAAALESGWRINVRSSSKSDAKAGNERGSRRARRPLQQRSHLSSEFAARSNYHPAAQPAAHPFAPSSSSGLDRKIIATPVAHSLAPPTCRKLHSLFLPHRAPAAPRAHYLSTRFRALALFGRRSPERVVRSSSPAAENLPNRRHHLINMSAVPSNEVVLRLAIDLQWCFAQG
jgi:hypothetical protein